LTQNFLLSPAVYSLLSWLQNESIASAWMDDVKGTVVTDKSPPTPPTNVRVAADAR
jgi:hypothetical protein